MDSTDSNEFEFDFRATIVIVCAAGAGFPTPKRIRRVSNPPYNSRFYSAPFALFAAIVLFGCGFAALAVRGEFLCGYILGIRFTPRAAPG